MHRPNPKIFLLLLVASLSSFVQGQTQNRYAPQREPLPVPPPIYHNSQSMDEQLWRGAAGHYVGWSPDTAFQGNASPTAVADRARWEAAQRHNEYDDYLERKRRREEALAQETERLGLQSHARPDDPDQSDLLKNSKDRDFILKNFRTLYVDAREAKFFDNQQMKAALGRNKEFQKLNIRIVDDPRVADAVLKVSYTFAWDYPFELRHQNTTYVLLAGKGEGPFSGPVGAADVARQFANAVRPWREEKKK